MWCGRSKKGPRVEAETEKRPDERRDSFIDIRAHICPKKMEISIE